MAELFLLNTAADVIDRRVGELDRMKVIHDQRRVREVLDERRPIARSRVERGERDPVAPVRSSVGQPTSQHVTRAALHDVEEPMSVQVDDLGREQGAMLDSGVQEPLLVDTDPAHPAEAGRVVDHRVGVVRDRCVGSMPADAELDRRRGDREPVDVDHVRQPAPGTFGQRRPRRDLIDVLAPRPQLTQQLRTPPASAGEHQHRRHPSDRQIPHRGPAAAVADSTDPAPRTPPRAVAPTLDASVVGATDRDHRLDAVRVRRRLAQPATDAKPSDGEHLIESLTQRHAAASG